MTFAQSIHAERLSCFGLTEDDTPHLVAVLGSDSVIQVVREDRPRAGDG